MWGSEAFGIAMNWNKAADAGLCAVRSSAAGVRERKVLSTRVAEAVAELW
jgi:hypothetical protein